jgi:hypothetical protein
LCPLLTTEAKTDNPKVENLPWSEIVAMVCGIYWCYLYTNNISICILLYVCESIILYDNKNYIYDIAK